MSEWLEDPEVMEALDGYMTVQAQPLGDFLNKILPFTDQTPIWAIVMLWGKFVTSYSAYRATVSETESWALSVADLANDPLAQELVASVMGSAANRMVGLDD